MNNFDRNNGQGWQQPSPQSWSNMYQTPFSTNIIYVTSPEEALMKTTQRNCEAVYFNQDKPEFYRVKVDVDGRKAWQAFQYTMPNPDLTTPATKAEFNDLLRRLEGLESRFQNGAVSTTEVINNVESNG